MRPGIRHTLRTRLESERRAPLHSLAYCLFGWDLNHRYVYDPYRFYECWGSNRHGLAVLTMIGEIAWYTHDHLESYIHWFPQIALSVGGDYWYDGRLHYDSHIYAVVGEGFEGVIDEIRRVCGVHHELNTTSFSHRP